MNWINCNDELPPEGKPVLVFFPKHRRTGYPSDDPEYVWEEGIEVWQVRDVGAICSDKKRHGEKAWYNQHFTCAKEIGGDCAPSHWMPMPAPPEGWQGLLPKPAADQLRDAQKRAKALTKALREAWPDELFEGLADKW